VILSSRIPHRNPTWSRLCFAKRFRGVWRHGALYGSCNISLYLPLNCIIALVNSSSRASTRTLVTAFLSSCAKGHVLVLHRLCFACRRVSSGRPRRPAFRNGLQGFPFHHQPLLALLLHTAQWQTRAICSLAKTGELYPLRNENSGT
jgi:hypothetical protein